MNIGLGLASYKCAMVAPPEHCSTVEPERSLEEHCRNKGSSK